ncbi:MAG: response regulator transcription factor [Oscillospiraceae bacterium]|nr:response regulator transcription factor [Oscillospiraceae bacterium]
MTKIAIVEDDEYLRKEIILTFKKKGYLVSGISSFVAPERDILDLQPDLVVLDINLPGKSGFELCKWLKARTSFPILILTARDKLNDELTALGLGADDFLIKPCHPDRLLARAGRLLQTYGKVKNIIQCGELSLDTDTYKLVLKDRHRILTETEGKILRLLMEKHPQLVSHKELLSGVWGTEEFIDENILQVNMTRLRKSLGEMGLEGIVMTIRGQGYNLEVSDL